MPLWALIHKRQYFALQPFATICTRSDFAVHTVLKALVFFIATSCVCVCVLMGGCHSFALVGLESLFPFTLCVLGFWEAGVFELALLRMLTHVVSLKRLCLV